MDPREQEPRGFARAPKCVTVNAKPEPIEIDDLYGIVFLNVLLRLCFH